MVQTLALCAGRFLLPTAAHLALVRAALDRAPRCIVALRRIGTEAFATVRHDWRQIQAERRIWAAVPYPVILVTVDALVHAGGHVLLVRRGRSPGKGLWAIPGGFLETRESVQEAAVRELIEETGIPLTARQARSKLRGVKVFDHPERSQRGRVITHAFFFDLGDAPPPRVQGGDDAAEAPWIPLARLPSLEAQLHDDHFHMMASFGLVKPGEAHDRNPH